ncbi:CsbD family protein [Tianweitania populi]|uniref:CsbD family protein n=1 Tax=Tianweitania populi TaxID=1607949 RepID=A0A8J3GKP7_9HYPH|nr:CsbD family protein [Tianweitania populi]GHD14114.1 CsbD family protein [Tianweitania populi]
MVNKDQVEGVGKQVKGAVKDAVGGATGDTSMQVDGKLDKAEGKVQKGVGDVKSDAARKLEE